MAFPNHGDNTVTLSDKSLLFDVLAALQIQINVFAENPVHNLSNDLQTGAQKKRNVSGSTSAQHRWSPKTFDLIGWMVCPTIPVEGYNTHNRKHSAATISQKCQQHMRDVERAYSVLAFRDIHCACTVLSADWPSGATRKMLPVRSYYRDMQPSGCKKAFLGDCLFK